MQQKHGKEEVYSGNINMPARNGFVLANNPDSEIPINKMGIDEILLQRANSRIGKIINPV